MWMVLREAGRKSVKAKKLRRALEGEEEWEISDSAPSGAEFSDPEDDFLGDWVSPAMVGRRQSVS